MSEETGDKGDEKGISNNTAEIATSLGFLFIGAVVMFDTQRLGASWSSDGPQSGYFPFYVALIMSLASLGILVQAILKRGKSSGTFATHEQLISVFKVLVPAVFFVVGIYFLGVYVAGALYIAFFMMWLGKYSLLRSVAMGIVISVLMFLTFEVWFLVPLPKGPIEALLGY